MSRCVLLGHVLVKTSLSSSDLPLSTCPDSSDLFASARDKR